MRTFLAIELEPEIKEAIRAGSEPVRSVGLKTAWVKESSMHLTLKFLGEMKLEMVPRITAALSGVVLESAPFLLKVQGMGAFPNPRRPRVIWAGVQEKTGVLSSLWRRAEEALSDLGFKKEGRGFHPHITIGRIRGTPRDITAELEDSFEGGEQEVSEIVLFQSDLNPAGAIHTPLAHLPLGERD